MSVVRQVQQFLLPASQRDEQSPEPPQVTSRLYRCSPCGETYISDGMNHCPSCDSDVEVIPSERDLGFV